MKFKIAVVQLEIQQFSPAENLQKIEKFIKLASKKADVIVFPEDFITGSLIEGDGQDWFNTTYYIDAKGKIKGKYRKINLWHPERRYLTPGKQISVFNTKYGKAGLIICWDLIYPEIFREMVKKRVNIVYCPSFWTKEDASRIGMKYDKNAEIKNVNSLCIARAFENEIVLVYVNAAGKLKVGKIDNNLIGQSQITMPFKGAIKKLNHNREQMFVQEIDTKITEDAEKVYKIRKKFVTNEIK